MIPLFKPNTILRITAYKIDTFRYVLVCTAFSTIKANDTKGK